MMKLLLYRYRNKAKELRAIFLDQPQSGIDKVIWWCEYVIRHKGAKHLRSPAADIPLYEYFMLDVLAFVVVSFCTTILIIRYLIKLIKLAINKFSGNKEPPQNRGGERRRTAFKRD